MRPRTIFIGVGILVGVLAYVGYQKIMTLKAIFDKMTIRPSGLSGLSLTPQYFSFKLDFEINNPTNEAFSLTGASIATIKRILVYRQGKFLGMANVNIGEIEIPAISTIELKHVPFQVSVQNVLENLTNIENFSIAELTIVCVVDVLGREYIIEG